MESSRLGPALCFVLCSSPSANLFLDPPWKFMSVVETREGQGKEAFLVGGPKEGDCRGKVHGLGKRERSIDGRESQKQGKMPKKPDHESSGGLFIWGFGCLTRCTATAPSARKVREMSSRCGSHHSRDFSLTKSYTEEARVTHLLSCYAEVFNMRKQNFRDKVLFLF